MRKVSTGALKLLFVQKPQYDAHCRATLSCKLARAVVKFTHQRPRTITQLTFLKIHKLHFRERFPPNTFCGNKELGASVPSHIGPGLPVRNGKCPWPLPSSLQGSSRTRSGGIFWDKEENLVPAFVGHVRYISNLWMKVRILSQHRSEGSAETLNSDRITRRSSCRRHYLKGR